MQNVLNDAIDIIVKNFARIKLSYSVPAPPEWPIRIVIMIYVL
jgi:hypothetical protein